MKNDNTTTKAGRLHPLAKYVPDEDLQKLGFDPKDNLSRMKVEKDLRVETTGEFRCPRRGEWFVSGAFVEGYRASNDIGTPYHIARLVLTETKTVITVTKRA